MDEENEKCRSCMIQNNSNNNSTKNNKLFKTNSKDKWSKSSTKNNSKPQINKYENTEQGSGVGSSWKNSTETNKYGSASGGSSWRDSSGSSKYQ